MNKPSQDEWILWLWLAGAMAMLAGPAVYWWELSPRDLSIPENIVERINPEFGALLRLISDAKRVIPAGSTYTVLAREPDMEMALLNFSYADLRDAVAMPTSYYRYQLPDVGPRARYVIAYRCDAQESRARMILQTPEGCVLERIPRAQ